jgi:3-deoxy-D-manno-octulosonic-acid transferase
MLFSKSLYHIGNYIYFKAIYIISPFSKKAKKWVDGRKDWKEKLVAFSTKNTKKVIWLHAASLGEFEQGRPLIESIKKTNPNLSIVVSFFSPSGYDIRKNYELADYVCYLPTNSSSNAQFFIDQLQPVLVLWVKYDYWSQFLSYLHKKNIPNYLISSIFKKRNVHFKPYGSFWVEQLKWYKAIFVQNTESQQLLTNVGVKSEILGDTRFDRVNAVAQQSFSNETITHFINNQKVIIAGSTWLEDEEVLCHFANKNAAIKMIIAPHHIDTERIAEIKKLFINCTTFSDYKPNGGTNVLILDTIGILSFIYRYATICYIGGGFNSSGIHNCIEAAVYGKPIIFGPSFENFAEAIDLIELEAAFSIESAVEIENLIAQLLSDTNLYNQTATKADTYVQSKLGSTNKILEIIRQNGDLPNP